MSDQSGGQGWWMASDGKWYRPEQHPDYEKPRPEAAPVGSSTRPTSAPSVGRGRRTLWVGAGVLVVATAAVVAFVVLAGGDNEAPVRSTTTLSPAEELASYQRQYLELVAPANCAQDAMHAVQDQVFGEDGLVDENDWPVVQAQMQPAYRNVAATQIAFYEALSQADWPDNAQQAVDNLVAEMANEAAAWTAAGGATTFDQWARLEIPDGANAAAVVRARLKLPSNLTDDDHDWCSGPPVLPT